MRPLALWTLLLVSLFAGCAKLEIAAPQLRSDRYERCGRPGGADAFREAERLAAKGDFAAAAAGFRRAVELCPEHVVYHIRYQDAAASLPAEVVDGEPQPAPAKAAMEAFYEGYRDNGRSPLAPYFKARLQRFEQREAPAQDLLAEALRRDPQFYFAHYERGLIWRGIGRSHQAVQHYRRALATRPGCLLARRELAECYVELWEWSRAVEQYRVYLDAAPQDVAAQRAYLSLLVYRVDDELPQADALVKLLLEASPDDLSLRMDQAAIQWRLGNLMAAAAGYRDVLRGDHQAARAALNLGNLHYDLGRDARGEPRRKALETARRAYRYFLALEKAKDGYDWFDQNVSVPARLREIDLELGARTLEVVTWRDL